jgi:hypothetical protein
MRTLSFFRIRLTGSADAGHGRNSSLPDNHAACQAMAIMCAKAVAICPIIPKDHSPYRIPKSSSITN